MQRYSRQWLCILCLLLLTITGCEAEAIDDKGNLNFDVLIAYAGADQFVEQGSEVSLKAKNLAADAVVQWEVLQQPAQSAFALQDDTAVSFSYTADTFGTWEFKLTAMRGTQKSSDTVKISTVFHAPPFDTDALTFYYDPQVPSADQAPWAAADNGLTPPDVADQSPVVIPELRAMDTGRFFSTRCEFSQYRFAPTRLVWTGQTGDADGMGVTFASKNAESWNEAFVCLNQEACGGRWFRLATMQGSTPLFKAGKALPEDREIAEEITIDVQYDENTQSTVAVVSDAAGTIVELSVEESLFGWGGIGAIVYRPRGAFVFTSLESNAHIKANEQQSETRR